MFRDVKTAKPVAWEMGGGTIDATVITSIGQEADSEATRSVLVNLNRHFYFAYQPMRITKKFLEYVRASKKDCVMQMIAAHPECLFAKYGKDQSPFHAAMTIGDTDLLESMEPYIYLVPGAVELTLQQVDQLLNEIDAFEPYDFSHVINVISNATYDKDDKIDAESMRKLANFKDDFMAQKANTGFDFDLRYLLDLIRMGVKKFCNDQSIGAPWEVPYSQALNSTIFLDLLRCLPMHDLQMYCEGMSRILIFRTKFSRILYNGLLTDSSFLQAFTPIAHTQLSPMDVARDVKIYYLKQLRDRLQSSLMYADLQSRQAHVLHGYILRGEVTQAVALIAANPALLFVECANMTTPFEVMLSAGDTSLLVEVEPYLSKVLNGLRIAAELFAKQFPNGVYAYTPIDYERMFAEVKKHPRRAESLMDIEKWNEEFDAQPDRSTGLHFNLRYLRDFVNAAFAVRMKLQCNLYDQDAYDRGCVKMIENMLQRLSVCDAQAICQHDPFRRHDTSLVRSIKLAGDLPGKNFYTRLLKGLDSQLGHIIVNAIGAECFYQGHDYDSDDDDDDNQQGVYKSRLVAFYENKAQKLADFQTRLKANVALRRSM